SWFRPHVLSLRGFKGWDALTASPVLSEVRALNLRLRKSDETLQPLATASQLGHLRRRRLSGDDQEAAALQALFSSDILANVEELHFTSHNGKGSAGLAAALGQSRRLGHLRHLDLFMNPLTDAGAALLAKAPALAGVRELKMHFCGI